MIVQIVLAMEKKHMKNNDIEKGCAMYMCVQLMETNGKGRS